MWKLSSQPPKTEAGTWSEDVIVVTNFGNVFEIAYYRGDDVGIWQRPAAFITGEIVEFWTDKPDIRHPLNEE